MKSLTSILLVTGILGFFNPAAFSDTDTSSLKELLSARASLLKPLYEKVPKDFLKAVVIVRRGIDDFGGLTTRDYLRRLHLSHLLSDRGCAWRFGRGWLSSRDQYELRCSYRIVRRNQQTIRFDALFRFVLSNQGRVAFLRTFLGSGRETDAYKSSVDLLGVEPGDMAFKGNEEIKQLYEDFKNTLQPNPMP